jgi:dTDP-4-dehydrorhamnose reductase
VDVRQLDVRDVQAVQRLIGEVRPQVVIDCVAVPKPELLGPVVVDGARNLARASAAAGAVHILLSTDNVFDGCQGWYGEEDPVSPVHAYGKAKAAAEELVLRLAHHPVVIRTSLVCGLEPLDPRSRWVVDALRGGEPIQLFTDEFRCPIWVDDLVAAIVELSEGSYRGILHVVGPERHSRYEIGAMLAAWLGLDRKPLVPALACRTDLRRTLDGSLATGRARRVLSRMPGAFAERFKELIAAREAAESAESVE